MKHNNKIFSSYRFGILLGLLSLLSPFVFAYANSISIQSLSPSTNIPVGTTVSFTVAASGFTSPSYSISDSFGVGTTISDLNIDSSGNFSWTPTNSDVGTHNFTITVSDSSSNSGTVDETITVGSTASISIQSLSPSSAINTGQTVSFSVVASGFTSPSYLLSDSFNGSTISNSNIDSSGNFSWTPITQDAGNHTITVTVTDTSGHSATATENLTVNSAATVVIQSLSPTSTINQGQTVSFTAAASGFSGPLYLLSDSFSGGTISNSNINSSGNFSWTPASSDMGTHNITVYVTDSSSHSANTSITIYVSSNTGVSLILTSPYPNSTIAPGTTVGFTAYGSVFISPSFALIDSFSGTSIYYGDINSSGVFTWTPTVNDTGIHNITVTATDSYGHNASANVQITVSGTTGTATGQVLGETSHVFNVYLYPGSRGDDVTALQTILIQQGFLSGSATGYYGSLTQSAVKKFQTAHGIETLGVVGPQTRTVLNQLQSSNISPSSSSSNNVTLLAQLQALENQLAQLQAQQNGLSIATTSSSYKFLNPLNVGSVGADVTELQNRLTSEGVYSGPITGTFGSLTQAGVKKYQTLHGLSPLGNVGPGTRAALNGQ